MNKKPILFGTFLFLIAIVGFLGVVSAETTLTIDQYNNAKDIIVSASNRILALQDSAGSWDWVVTGETSSMGENNYNLAGVIAEGLLDAYKLTNNDAYLDGAKLAGDYIVSVPISPAQRQNSANILFLYHLSDVTGDLTYKDKANAIMNSLLHNSNAFSEFDTDGTFGLNAHELLLAYEDYRNYWSGEQNGIVPWDLYQFVEDAKIYGDNVFANDMANEIKAYLDQPTYTSSVNYYALGLSSGIEALNEGGMDYSSYLTSLLAIQNNPDNSFGTLDEGQIQTTSYSVLALAPLSDIDVGAELSYLIDEFDGSFNGWMETDGNEYAESNSEAVQAIYSVIFNTETIAQTTSVELPLDSGDSNNIQVVIPAGTTITGNLLWDGITINPPTMKSSPTNFFPADGFTRIITKVTEVGFSGVRLNLSQPVKILIPGEAGKLAGYSRGTGDTFHLIETLCSFPDIPSSIILQFASSSIEECYGSVGSDLVIWTKHFTEFVTYTQTPGISPGPTGGSSGGSSGGGGGGGGAAPSAIVNNTINNTTTDGEITNLSDIISGASPTGTTGGAPITGGVIGTLTSPFGIAGIAVFVVLIVIVVIMSKRKKNLAEK